jgi:hypothetical protein
MSLKYFVANEEIITENLQMEIDLTMELNGVITIFEAKNGFPKNFAIYQIFHPFKYYSNLKKEKELDIKQINCCYILIRKEKGNSFLKLYSYTFEDENNMTSIKLLKCSQYNLIKRF